jgi:alpha-beta hydrolase superfamily lysophospholipase
MPAGRIPTIDDIAEGSRPCTWAAADGAPFPGLVWEPPDGAPVANVLCIHGLSGAAADFGPLARHLSRRGCSVRAINVRGQGNDPEPSRRGHFLDPAGWRADLAAFVRDLDGDIPLFVVGESMGALIAVDAVAHGALRPERLVLSVPVTQIRAPVPGWVVSAMRAISCLCPRARLSPLRFVHGKTSLPRLTADDEYMAYLQTIPHRVGGFSLGFLAGFHDFMARCHRCAADVRVPTLLLAAGRDIFIKPEQSRAFFEALGAEEKHFILYPQSHHLLWHDVNREDVLEKISTWIVEERTP